MVDLGSSFDFFNPSDRIIMENNPISKQRGIQMAGRKMILRFDDYVKGIERLKPEEQLSLIEIISARLKRTLKGKEAKHHVTELEGLGAHLWKSIDVERYINEERKSWD
jgi:hypothetical protein